jgi:4'-phosphopantetheinyl transferase
MPDPVVRHYLAKNEVHVWSVSLEDGSAHVPDLDVPELLSSEEIARYGKISQPLLRQRFLRSRSAMRVILAAYAGLQPEYISYHYNDNGKPGIDLAGGEQQLEFNLSHSSDLCLLAVTLDSEIGIDIECCSEGRDYLALARRFFSQPELELIEHSTDAGLFYRMWVLKEAAVKARGMRLLSGLDRFECTHGPGAGLVVMDRVNGEEHHLWCSRVWQPASGTVAAVVVKNPDAVFIEKVFS